MTKRSDSGRNPTDAEIREVERIGRLPESEQRRHPSAVPADAAKLAHINTYGSLPEYYIDVAFQYRDCGAVEIWRAADQKWYYEEAKGHIDATG